MPNSTFNECLARRKHTLSDTTNLQIALALKECHERKNSDNSISILTTSVDPVVETNSPAWKSLAYGVGAQRVFGLMDLTDTTSHTYNVELVKTLSTNMQAVIARYGEPLGHHVAIDRTETGAVINFLGELQSADTLLGPWSDVANTSPYAVSAANAAKFYRAVE